jgi:hypothetical protein
VPAASSFAFKIAASQGNDSLVTRIYFKRCDSSAGVELCRRTFPGVHVSSGVLLSASVELQYAIASILLGCFLSGLLVRLTTSSIWPR